MICEEVIWITAGILVAVLLFRPRNTQVQLLVRLAVAIVTLILWASMPGIGASCLFPLFVLPVLVALLPGATWKKWVVLYGVFHVASMFVLFGTRITWGDAGLYSVVYTAVGVFYAAVFWFFRCLRRPLKEAILNRHKRIQQ